MSLIVLNSKGNSPEEFTNTISSGIKIPVNAEICLVSSNVQRKYLYSEDLRIESGSNTFVVGIGTGANPGTTTRVNGIDYTPFKPSIISMENTNNKFPIVLNSHVKTTNFMESQLNNTKNILSSPYTGDDCWDVTLDATKKMVIKCTLTIPDLGTQQGTTEREQIIIGQGIDGGEENNNVTAGNYFASTAVSTTPGHVDLRAGEDAGYFIDSEPLYNTNTGQAFGTWTGLPNPNPTGIAGGCYSWQITPQAGEMVGLRGGIIANNSTSTTAPTSGDNFLIAPLTGGSNYSLWWECVKDDGVDVYFEMYYINPPKLQFLRKAGVDYNKKIKCGSFNVSYALGGDIRIMCRPVHRGPTGFMMDWGYARADAGTGALTDITNVSADTGGVKITDPEASDGGTAANAFDLYNHLPIRQGFSFAKGTQGVKAKMGAIHHKDKRRAGAGPGFLGCVLGWKRPDQSDYISYNPDQALQSAINRTNCSQTLGYGLAFQSLDLTQLTATGFIGIEPLGEIIPYNDCLVVQSSTLGVNGLLGNSKGSVASGTSAISSGGNPAPILAVIPLTEYQTGIRSLPFNRSEFFAQPIDNWIKLNNTTSYVLNQISIKITDSLGSKPNRLDGNTCLTFKIRQHKRTPTVVQGAGSNPQPINDVKTNIMNH